MAVNGCQNVRKNVRKSVKYINECQVFTEKITNEQKEIKSGTDCSVIDISLHNEPNMP